MNDVIGDNTVSDMKIAELVEIDRTNTTLSIDGVAVGYYLADEPTVSEVRSDGLTRVTVVLLAEKVTVTP